MEAGGRAAEAASGLLARLVDGAMTQPVAPAVPADDAHFLASKGALKVALRALRQRSELAASGQSRLWKARIDPAWRRALWLHAEAPQIGDALMDLAPRSLLAEHGIEVDLLAPPATAALFTGDRGFGRVFAAEADVPTAGYDFAITDSRSGRALAAKRRCVPGLPWVSIRENYLPYDFQRGLLAARRVADLLGVRLDATSEAWHARQKLMLHDDAVAGEPRQSPWPRVAIALGGVRSERSYRQWRSVAEAIAARGPIALTLLGSANARADADDVARASLASPSPAPLDLVQRTDLHEARRAMQASDLVLCADGGLMHLSLTTTTPVLALFDASVDPAWRLPASFVGTTLRAAGRDVNLIAPTAIADAALALLATPAARVSDRAGEAASR